LVLVADFYNVRDFLRGERQHHDLWGGRCVEAHVFRTLCDHVRVRAVVHIVVANDSSKCCHELRIYTSVVSVESPVMLPLLQHTFVATPAYTRVEQWEREDDCDQQKPAAHQETKMECSN
jgi:hypothetical protein